TFGFGGTSTDEDCRTQSAAQDGSKRSWGDLVMVLSTYTLAPLWTTLMLWVNRFITEDRHQHYLLVAITPVFLLHALWLFFVLRVIRPHEGDLLPLRLRTVGYLNIFTQDKLEQNDPSASKIARYDADTPHGHRTLVGQTSTAMQSAMSAQSVPWLVVNRFTKTMICMWIAGGAMHFFHTVLRATADVDFETAPNNEDPDDQWENKETQTPPTGARRPSPRRLRGAPRRPPRGDACSPLPAGARGGGPWPRRGPRRRASSRRVAGLHCNNSHAVVRSPFRVYEAALLPQDGPRPGPPRGGAPRRGTAAVLCGLGRCDVLARDASGAGAWRLSPGGVLPGVPGEGVPIPAEMTGAWPRARGWAAAPALAGSRARSRATPGLSSAACAGAARARGASASGRSSTSAPLQPRGAALRWRAGRRLWLWRGAAPRRPPLELQARLASDAGRAAQGEEAAGGREGEGSDQLEDVRQVVALHLDPDLQTLEGRTSSEQSGQHPDRLGRDLGRFHRQMAYERLLHLHVPQRPRADPRQSRWCPGARAGVDRAAGPPASAGGRERRRRGGPGGPTGRRRKHLRRRGVGGGPRSLAALWPVSAGAEQAQWTLRSRE
ncbi:unnamed protein product, partial [Prorocentrum cordatum]